MLGRRTGREQQPERDADDDDPESRTRCIGESDWLALLQAADEGHGSHAGDEPGPCHDGVDDEATDRERGRWPQERSDTPDHLQRG